MLQMAGPRGGNPRGAPGAGLGLGHPGVHDALRTGLLFRGAARCFPTNHKIDQLGKWHLLYPCPGLRLEQGFAYSLVKITMGATMTTYYYMAQLGDLTE